MGAAAGAVAAAAAAAAANAIKATGVVVRVEPAAFLAILARAEAPLVVTGQGGLFTTHYQYLTSYKGLAFFTRSPEELALPRGAEVVRAESISIPDL
jgi:hypothetical protein